MSLQEREVGPYKLLAPLGEGNMGRVFRACHKETGRLVALKSVRVPREDLLRSIRREIKALARLSHPGIVRILDEGVHQGLPYYAMELLQGQTLGCWRDSLLSSEEPTSQKNNTARSRSAWWTPSLSGESLALGDTLPQGGAYSLPGLPTAQSPPTPLQGEALLATLRMVRRLCAPLAFLHGEGLVHRDLKPENILVVEAGNKQGIRDEQLPIADSPYPVLVDFGLAGFYGGESSREQISVEAGIAGTVYYMSPEQLRAEPLDARADLYSLGCILFALLTGRPPFSGETPIAILQAHLSKEPPRLSQFIPGVPAALDALVLRLLQKERQKRPGYAEDVARILAEITEEGNATWGPRPRTYLYRPTLSGREPQLERLRQYVGRLTNTGGGVVLLGGESGVGKTRLAVELARETVGWGLAVLAGECQERETRSPLEAFRKPLQEIADRCREKGEEETERLLGHRGKVLALYEPSLASLPGQEKYPQPAELPAQAAQQRVFSFLAQTLTAFCEDKPLLLLLDDLQWADDLSLGFLSFLLSYEPLRRWLLVVGTYRSEEVGEGLRRLREDPRCEKLLLERLGEEAVKEMVGDMLGLSRREVYPETFSRSLAKSTEGNPFFIAEYLRAAVEEGILGRDVEGRWQVRRHEESFGVDFDQLSLPRTLKELVERRLSGLSSEAREVVDAGSVLGREAELSFLEQAATLPESAFEAALEELRHRQILEEKAPGLFRFVHDKLREVCYGQLTPPARSRLHRRAAEILEGDGAQVEPGILGLHWEEAGAPEKAREYYLKGARKALGVYSYQEAEKLYRAYLRLNPAPSEESIRARNELGEKIFWTRGRTEEAEQEHARALQEARDIGSQSAEAESLWRLGWVRGQQGQVEEARALYEQALALARACQDRSCEGAILMQIANMDTNQGRKEEARRRYEQALTIHRETRNRRAEGLVLSNLAVVISQGGRKEEARQLYEQSLIIWREVGERRVEGITFLNLGITHMDQGHHEEAEHLFQQAVVLLREVGERPIEGIALASLGNLYTKQGRYEEARSLFTESLVILREARNRRYEGIVLDNLAELDDLQGRDKEAQALYSQALTIHRATQDRRSEGSSLRSLANLFRDRGKLEEAEPLYQQSLALLREAGARDFEGITLDHLAELRLMQGRLEDAQALYSQALTIHREVGNQGAEASTLCGLAELARWHSGDLEEGEKLCAQAEALLTQTGNKPELLKLLCIRGHLALARNESAGAFLQQAHALAQSLPLTPKSPLSKRLAALMRAQIASRTQKTERLFRGQLLEDIPAPLLQRLRQAGQATAPQKEPGDE